MKAKLVDGRLQWQPNHCTVGNTDHIPPTEEWLAENGYKEVIYTDKPADDNVYAEGWEETEDAYIQSWVLIHKTSNKERREREYETNKCIVLDDGRENERLTVDEANQLYLDYLIEERDMTDLKAKIITAKNDIRTRYPDEN